MRKKISGDVTGPKLYICRYICTMHIHFGMHNHKDVADLPDEDNVVGVSEAVKCYIYRRGPHLSL